MTACSHNSNYMHATEQIDEIIKVSDDLYLIYGGNGNGANIGVLFTDNGVLLIDGKKGEYAPSILAWIRSKTDKPIKYVINTHSHSDHSGANVFWAKQGATIINQDNARTTDIFYQLTFKEQLNLFFGEERIVIHAVEGHTQNDVFVYLKKNNVLFMGDNYSNDWLPISRLRGQKNNIISQAVALTDPDTRIIPGHGTMSTQQSLKNYSRLLPVWFSTIEELDQKGLSVEQIIEEPSFLTLSKKFNPGTILKPVPKEPAMKNIVRSVVRELQE